MQSIVIDRQILPEPIFSCIQSEKIRMFEENGNIVLSPLKVKPNAHELFGMLSDGKLSSEDFIRDKALEKELETSDHNDIEKIEKAENIKINWFR